MMNNILYIFDLILSSSYLISVFDILNLNHDSLTMFYLLIQETVPLFITSLPPLATILLSLMHSFPIVYLTISINREFKSLI
jgi:hypothetical protein